MSRAPLPEADDLSCALPDSHCLLVPDGLDDDDGPTAAAAR